MASIITDLLLGIKEVLVSASIITKGTATGGTNTTLVDANKNFEADALNGEKIVFTVGGVEYHKTITDSGGSTITFATLPAAVAATATIGKGADDEGKVVVECEGDNVGALGNDYSIIITHGEDTTEDIIVTLDEEEKIILVVVNLDAEEQEQTLTATALHTSLSTAEELSGKFTSDGDSVVVGEIPVDGTPITFAGGKDAVVVTAGVPYEVSESS